jgi:hypothetical protein
MQLFSSSATPAVARAINMTHEVVPWLVATTSDGALLCLLLGYTNYNVSGARRMT